MRKGFFLPLIIISVTLLLTVTVAVFYLKDISSKKTTQISNNTLESTGNILNKASDNKPINFKNGLKGNKALNDMILVLKRVDNVTNKPIYYKYDGTLISDCGADGHLSHDRTKILTSDKLQIGSNIFLTDLECSKPRQLTYEGRGMSDKYKATRAYPIAWSPDDKQFLYNVIIHDLPYDYYKKPRAEDPSIKTGLYLFDLESQKSIFLSDNVSYGDNFIYWGKEYKNPLFRADPAISQLDLHDKILKPFSSITKGSFSPQIEVEADGYFLWSDGQPGLSNNDINSYSQIILSKFGEGDVLKITPKGRWAEYQGAKLSPDGTKIIFLHGYQLGIYNFADESIKDLGIHSSVSYWLDSNTILSGIATEDYRSPLIDLYKINVNTGEKQLFMKNVISGTVL